MSRLGAWANDATLTPSRMSRSMRSSMSGWSARRFTPKGLSVRSLTSPMAVRSSGKVMVAEARMPSPPAALVADGQAGAGHPAHAGLHDRVLDPEQLADAACAGRGVAVTPRTSALRGVVRVDAPRGSAAARRRSAAGSRRRRRRPPARSRWPPRPRRPSRRGAPMRRRMRWSGVSKSSVARLVTTRRISWNRDATGPSSAARS